jgi:ATP-binding cassette subfamily B protein
LILKSPSDSSSQLLRHAEKHLGPGERVIARLETDLDANLHFQRGLLVLTDRRLVHTEAAVHGEMRFLAWSLAEIDEMELEEMGATASIHLIQGGIQTHAWRIMTGRVREADVFLARFKDQHRIARSDLKVDPVALRSEGEDEEVVEGGSEVKGFMAGPMVRLFAFAKPWHRLMVLGFLLTLASTATSLIAPWLTMALVDNVLIPLQSATEEVHVNQVYKFMAQLAGAGVLTWVLNWARTFVVARLAERVTSRMRRETFEHLQRLSLTYFNRKRTGDLISRIGSDTDHISLFLSVNFIEFVCDVLQCVFLAVILFWINPLLAVAAMGPAPLVGWLVSKVRGHLRGGFAAASRAWSAMNSVLSDTIPGVRVVKAFAQEQREIERFRATDKHIFDTNDRVNRMWSFFTPMIELLTDVGLLVVWAAGAWSVAHHHITVGVLTGFVLYIQKLYGRVESMSKFVAAAQRASASAHRVFEILDVKPDMPVNQGMRKVGRLSGEIDFKGVKFRHGSRQVIKGINLKIAPGEMIGLVGPSGAGKTTLVNLACRFFDVSEGSIWVDGMDLRELDVEDYRKNLGLVLQEPYLFYGTIAENIAYGKPKATKAEIIAAARAARAHDFIMRTVDGYDSMVGERGQQLSGGERQRISIARALLIDPAILILDEATSSVDTETEREIQAALDYLVKGRTTIAIAHRLGTLRRANRLIVMEDGRIVETGTHDQLLNQSGTYARLHEAMMEVTSQ